MRLVLIHGRDQQGKPADDLKQEWTRALLRGYDAAGLKAPSEVEVHFPYYGDELAKLITELDAPLLQDVRTKGSTIPDEEMRVRGQMLEEMARNAGITDHEILAYYSGKPQEKGPLNWEWVHAILKALDRTRIGDRSIDWVTRDVYVYLTVSAVRQRINAIVTTDIGRDPCVVVAHSLGTVVAYDVLALLGAQAKVRHLITVGSPLGVKSLQHYLVPPALAMPVGVGQWSNAFDERDVVALRALDQRSFAITPSIRNHDQVKNGTQNRHGIRGYLDDAQVATWIHQALTA